MNTAPMIRLHLFFATENDSALILRRSRDRQYNLIGWDRATDAFTQGQWIRKFVRPENCSLSPDGQHFMYHVRNANPATDASEHYTVISRPPWFTALALFPQGGTWVAGGSFLDNTLYRIAGDDAVSDIRGEACDLTRVVAGKVTKDCRTGLRLRNGKAAPLSKSLRERLLNDEPLPRDTALDHYETQAGRLYRREGMDLRLIHDFTQMAPKFERAPYDNRVPSDTPEMPWHPADADRAK